MLSMMMTACGTMRGIGMRVSGVCVAFTPISFSAKGDTKQTVREVRGYNAAYDVVCPEDKKDE